MKKIFNDKRVITSIGTIIAMIILFLVFTTGCGNRQIFEAEYTFNRAYCNYDGTKFVLEIKKWTDYEGEQIQIIDTKGDVYLISANKCYLTK